LDEVQLLRASSLLGCHHHDTPDAGPCGYWDVCVPVVHAVCLFGAIYIKAGFPFLDGSISQPSLTPHRPDGGEYLFVLRDTGFGD
jgi:hypothetical protein